MVGAIGVIFLVTGLRRAASYLVSTASIIFWMMVCFSSRISK